MRITPLDIRKQEFRKAMRGLDAEEVYAFLSTVGDEYELVLNDNKALRERLMELDDKVQEYRTMEKTLRDTLLTAERVTVEAKDNARREANLIIKEAQIEADRSLRDIKSEAMKLRQAVSQLRSQRESYLGRMKVIAESLLKFIEGVEEDFYKEDEAYKDQLPEEQVAKPSAAPPDPSIKNGSLFDASAAKPEPRSAPQSATVPSADVEDGFRPVPGPAPDVQAPAAKPVPAPSPDEARSETDPQTTMAKINSIIERMADGQVEAVPGAPQPVGPAPYTTRQTEQFDPASAAPDPSGPIASSELSDEPPQTLEATTTTDDPTPARGIPSVQYAADPSVPVDVKTQRASEVATAVKTADEGAGQAKSGNGEGKATSEISLEQIRRDLERRMMEDKDK